MIATEMLVPASTLQRPAAFAARPRRAFDPGDRATAFQAHAPSSALHRSSPAAVVENRLRRRPAVTFASASAVRVAAADGAQAQQVVAQSRLAVDSDFPAVDAEPFRTGSSFCRSAARTDRPAPAAPGCCPGRVPHHAKLECPGRSLRLEEAVAARVAQAVALLWFS